MCGFAWPISTIFTYFKGQCQDFFYSLQFMKVLLEHILLSVNGMEVYYYYIVPCSECQWSLSLILLSLNALISSQFLLTSRGQFVYCGAQQTMKPCRVKCTASLQCGIVIDCFAVSLWPSEHTRRLHLLNYCRLLMVYWHYQINDAYCFMAAM